MTDIKIFLLFLLDRIGNPIDHTSLINIVSENTREITLDYDQCLDELVKAGHLYYDTDGTEKYYMISDSGHEISAELYDTLDEGFREQSARSAIKFISLSARNASVSSYITEAGGKRFNVTLKASDRYGEILNTTLTVASRAEAEAISTMMRSIAECCLRLPDGWNFYLNFVDLTIFTFKKHGKLYKSKKILKKI